MNFLKITLITCSALIATPTLATTIVVNGDFESTNSDPVLGMNNNNTLGSLITGTGNGSWDRYTSIDGWVTTSGAGIEVQSNNTLGSIDAHSGDLYVELDSNNNSSMEQTLFLDAGRYELGFYYSPRTGDSGTNGIDYSISTGLQSIDLLLDGNVTGPSAAANTAVGYWTWITGIFTVTAPNSPITIAFAATGASNSYGGLLDDISISPVPLPASLPLLFTALAGLGLLRRRKTTI